MQIKQSVNDKAACFFEHADLLEKQKIDKCEHTLPDFNS